MHNTAYDNAIKFYTDYCASNIEKKTVLDVGSMDINGSLKTIFSSCLQYVGLDQEMGRNVDIVGSSHKMPFKDESFDIIVSTSCFEHDDMFWVTFLEMCRVVKSNGFIYINAPSNGPYHAHPVDNWRFYSDSWPALAKWAKYNNYKLNLVESYIDPIKSSCQNWNDSIGIFQKLQ